MSISHSEFSNIIKRAAQPLARADETNALENDEDYNETQTHSDSSEDISD